MKHNSGRKSLIALLAAAAFFTVESRAQIAGGAVLGNTAQLITQSLPTGPTLDVIPYVSADGHTIQMTLIPSVVEFVGYDTSPFRNSAQGGAGNTLGNAQSFDQPLPRVRVRQVVTSVSVWDGQTVVLGGLISDNVATKRDKVPVLGDVPLLGRLFRSESSVKTKKNLLILVTPTIIDPAGKRVHDPEHLPFDPNTTPQADSGR
jgi:general secretion pathway protein D